MITPDDPRLTTYVVDEVDPATRDAIEKALADSESARLETDEVRDMSRLLAAALAQDSAPALRPEQRRVVEEAAARVRRTAHRGTLVRGVLYGLAALLSIVVAASLSAPSLLRVRQPARIADGRVGTTRVAPSPSVPVGPSTPVRPVEVAPKPQTKTRPATRTVRAAEEVTVIGRAPTVSTESAEIGGEATVTGESVSSLPLNGRDFMQLTMLQPGVSGPADQPPPGNTESYEYRVDNEFLAVAQNPLSTFSLDVDTASYANVRRFLNQGRLPPADAVRIEEMVNYFPYDYEPPHGKDAFATHVEIAPAPWNKAHRLLRIGLKARAIPHGERPESNLVFLIDVSGSMNEPNKLPLVKRSLQLLVERLTGRDRVAIVVYAGAAGCVLPPTSGADQAALRAAIEKLEAGGSTNGAQGIELAYSLASQQFIKGGVNRVILATDGDFNVGITDEGSLVRLIEEKAKVGVFLSVFGFGMGNYKDQTLELLADKGNGNYGYIDTLNEARKALVEQMDSTLVTVAKDVKIQVEFNPTRVQAYRLIGYENRLLRAEEFNDDKKDAGEVGAGHSVTALYEIVPASGHGEAKDTPAREADPLVYQEPAKLTAAARSSELMRLKLRYKEPEGSKSRLEQWPILDRTTTLERTSADFKFAASVAGFGLLLRDSPYKGDVSIESVTALAKQGLGPDEHGYRAEFVGLVEKAAALTKASK